MQPCWCTCLLFGGSLTQIRAKPVCPPGELHFFATMVLMACTYPPSLSIPHFPLFGGHPRSILFPLRCNWRIVNRLINQLHIPYQGCFLLPNGGFICCSIDLLAPKRGKNPATTNFYSVLPMLSIWQHMSTKVWKTLSKTTGFIFLFSAKEKPTVCSMECPTAKLANDLWRLQYVFSVLTFWFTTGCS